MERKRRELAERDQEERKRKREAEIEEEENQKLQKEWQKNFEVSGFHFDFEVLPDKNRKTYPNYVYINKITKTCTLYWL